MIVVPCGKSAAIQRAGRAGRIFDGECYRIYTESAYVKMPEKVIPQLLRIDLSNFLLKLMGLGIKDLLSFEMTDQPLEKNYIAAIDNLYAYELIDEDFNLTEKGCKAAELSLDIRSASLLLNSFDERFGCSREILMLVSMLQVQRDLFTNNSLAMLKAKKKVGSKEGDFLTLINIFLRYSRAKTNEQKKVCSELKLSHSTMNQVLRIHDQLLEQIKSFRRYKSSEEEMEDRYGEGKKQRYELKSSNDEY